MRGAFTVSVLATFLGCSGRGDGGATDAASVDAPERPNAAQWHLVTLGVDQAHLGDGSPPHPGRTANIVFSTKRCPEDLKGPTRYELVPEDNTLILSPQAWRLDERCLPAGPYRETVFVRFPHSGTWTIPTVEGPLDISVVEAPDVACGSSPRDYCQLDCDCERGERCLSWRGETGSTPTECWRPCQDNRDCGGGVCSATEGISGICGGSSECSDPSMCPDGFLCQKSACVAQFWLDDTTRRPCTSDADCDPGMRCAYRQGEAQARCEALCQSSSDGWCTGSYRCTVDGNPLADGVCELVDHVGPSPR